MKARSFPKFGFDQLMKFQQTKDHNVEDTFPDHCFISINDSIPPEEPWFKEDHKNVLRVFFDDVEFEFDDLKGQKAVPISTEQAEQIIGFLIDNKNRGVKECYVHCTAGVSRSVAVANFVNMFFSTGSPRVTEYLMKAYNDLIKGGNDENKSV